MVIDIELTLNRFGFRRLQRNKVQFAFLRLAVWHGLGKHAISFEVNWKVEDPIEKRHRKAWVDFIQKYSGEG